MRGPRLVVVAIVTLVAAGVTIWIVTRDEAPSTPAAPPARAPAPITPLPRALAPDAALRRAPIATARPPGESRARVDVIQPPATGGFAAWTGLEGTRPGELEAQAAAQGVPFDVARESRRLLFLVEGSRDRDRLAQRAPRPLADADWTAIDRAATTAIHASSQLVDDLRAGTVDAATALAQLVELQREYRAEIERRTGLAGAAFDGLFADLVPGLGD